MTAFAIVRVRATGVRYFSGYAEQFRPHLRAEWSPRPEAAILFVRERDAWRARWGLRGKRISIHALTLPVSDQGSGEGPDVGNRSPNPPQAVTAGETAPPTHRPISTAPRDGTRIDVWFGARRVTDVHWGRPYHTCGEAGSYCDCCPSYDGWCDDLGYLTDEDSPSDNQPTHWMPIPAGPEDEEPQAVPA